MNKKILETTEKLTAEAVEKVFIIAQNYLKLQWYSFMAQPVLKLCKEYVLNEVDKIDGIEGNTKG